MHRPTTLGELRRALEAGEVVRRPVRDEIRENTIRKLRAGETLFPGIHGYDDTVVPQIVNALLSRHHFILLGLRGQAKSRLLRALVTLLDEAIPVVAGCEINDDPLAPICAACRARLRDEGDGLPVAWRPREARYVEKLATPDVTIADLLGDIDPIKAAQSGRQLSDELTMHYGLLPRAHRGIFAVNELPDLAGKIQVGLFNILQEGDVQIKGYPVRLPLDVLMVFTANPEDYTARGKIITPLKDRLGSEIRTHYPRTRRDAMAITAQEAWLDRSTGRAASPIDRVVPEYVREIVEEIAFEARRDPKVDRRSGVSQRLPITVLENTVSNAERRALVSGEPVAVARVSDISAALPSITGKFELEYEGELKGADQVAQEIVRRAVATVFDGYSHGLDLQPIVEWFDLGGTLPLDDTVSAADLLVRASAIDGLREAAARLDPQAEAAAGLLASAVDFLLEGLWAMKRISRSDPWTYRAVDTPRPRPRVVVDDPILEDGPSSAGNKKYYN